MIVARTGQGDFADYYQKFNHVNVDGRFAVEREVLGISRSVGGLHKNGEEPKEYLRQRLGRDLGRWDRKNHIYL